MNIGFATNIAITGKLRSGKNAVADYLTEKYGYTQFAFGDELKRHAHELFEVDTSAKPRELYQNFGQWCRSRDPDIWVRKCFAKIRERQVDIGMQRADVYEKRKPIPFRAVITDLRQPNEFDRCRSEGYVIIRVTAPDSIRLERARRAGDNFDESTLNHETESHVDGFSVDYEIVNDRSLAVLYTQIDEIMTSLRLRNPECA